MRPAGRGVSGRGPVSASRTTVAIDAVVVALPRVAAHDGHRDPAGVALDQLGGARPARRRRTAPGPGTRGRGGRSRRCSERSGAMPATPMATSVWPSRHGRPNVSLMTTPTSTPSSREALARAGGPTASGSSGQQHHPAGRAARALVDAAVGAHEPVAGLGDQHRPDHPHDAAGTRRSTSSTTRGVLVPPRRPLDGEVGRRHVGQLDRAALGLGHDLRRDDDDVAVGQHGGVGDQGGRDRRRRRSRASPRRRRSDHGGKARRGSDRRASLTGSGWVRLAAWAPGDLDDRPGARQAVGERLGILHRDRRVVGAVHDDRRAGDLGEAIGDVVATEQARRRLAHQLLRAGLPLGDPPRVLVGVGDDDVGDDGGQLVDRTGGQPRVGHLPVLLEQLADPRASPTCREGSALGRARAPAARRAATGTRPGSCRRRRRGRCPR